MKVGDLVTLSAYGNSLGGLHRWSEYYRQVYKKPALVGLVIKVRKAWSPTLMYEVRWMEPNGPQGRDGQYGGTHFTRKDLKFVSRG